MLIRIDESKKEEVKCFLMNTKERVLKRKVKEANLFIRAKQRLSEAELKLWIYAILNAKEKNGRAYADLDLKKLVSEYLKEKSERFLTAYYKKVLQGLIKKTVFWVDKLEFLSFLQNSGVKKPIELLSGRIDAEIAISPIEAVELSGSEARVIFAELVSPIILYLSKQFTIYPVEIFRLKGRYSLILYRFLVQELKGQRWKMIEVETEFLKKLFSLESKKNIRIYSEIIQPAIEEINRKSSLRVETSPIRKGRGGKITKVAFKIQKQQSFWEEKILELLQEVSGYLGVTEETLKKYLVSFKRISPAIALLVLAIYPDDLKSEALNRLFELDSKKELKNPDAYILQRIGSFKDYKKYAWLVEDEIVTTSLMKILSKANDESKKDFNEKVSKEFWLSLL